MVEWAPRELQGLRLSRFGRPHHHHHHHDSKDNGMMATVAGRHTRNHHNHVAPRFRPVPKCRPFQYRCVNGSQDRGFVESLGRVMSGQVSLQPCVGVVRGAVEWRAPLTFGSDRCRLCIHSANFERHERDHLCPGPVAERR
eukprot:2254306-Alexandrium_andersonii.AAC.1